MSSGYRYLSREDVLRHLTMERGGRMLRRTYRQQVRCAARVGDSFIRIKRFAHFPTGSFSRQAVYLVTKVTKQWVTYRAVVIKAERA